MMRDEPSFDRAWAAKTLVRVQAEEGSWGMGFVTVGSNIVTAAHCIPGVADQTAIGSAWTGSHWPVLVRAFNSRQSAVALVHIAEVCGDLAVLSDSSSWGASLLDVEERMQRHFDRLLGSRSSATISVDPLMPGLQRLHVCTHDGRWISGTAIMERMYPDVGSRRIGPGTSGAPVFDGQGRVFGIVNRGSDDGSIHLVHLATSLPAWLPSGRRSADVPIAKLRSVQEQEREFLVAWRATFQQAKTARTR